MSRETQCCRARSTTARRSGPAAMAASRSGSSACGAEAIVECDGVGGDMVAWWVIIGPWYSHSIPFPCAHGEGTGFLRCVLGALGLAPEPPCQLAAAGAQLEVRLDHLPLPVLAGSHEVWPDHVLDRFVGGVEDDAARLDVEMELLDSEPEAALHRAQRHALQACDLGMTVALQVGELDRLPLLRGQAVQSLTEHRAVDQGGDVAPGIGSQPGGASVARQFDFPPLGRVGGAPGVARPVPRPVQC